MRPHERPRSIWDKADHHMEETSIRLISDRVLVRDLGDEEKVGSLWIPEIAREKRGAGKDGLLRLGIVVAVGPGDRFSEHGLDSEGNPRRRLLTKACHHCHGKGCGHCEAGRVPVTVPPQAQVGETVLYDVRKHEEVYIEGVRHSLIHCEQAVLAVIEKE